LNENVKNLLSFITKLAHDDQAESRLERAEGACVCFNQAIADLGTAVASFEQAAKLNPSSPQAYGEAAQAFLLRAQCEAALGAIADAKLSPSRQTSVQTVKDALKQKFVGFKLPPNLNRAMVDGQNNLQQALARLIKAKAEAALVTTERRDLAPVADQMAKKDIDDSLKSINTPSDKRRKGGTRQSKDAKDGTASATSTEAGTGSRGSQDGAGSADGSLPELAALQKLKTRLHRLREGAKELGKSFDADEQKASRKVADARREVSQTSDPLNHSLDLQRALRAANAACAINTYTDAVSLRALAQIYFSQGNFDQAVYYQKLAVIYATEGQRPLLSASLHAYESVVGIISEKKKPQTVFTPGGQSKGAKQSAQGDDRQSDDSDDDGA
jgi:tetratricopeptide (TPR) repeat protein